MPSKNKEFAIDAYFKQPYKTGKAVKTECQFMNIKHRERGVTTAMTDLKSGRA